MGILLAVVLGLFLLLTIIGFCRAAGWGLGWILVGMAVLPILASALVWLDAYAFVPQPPRMTNQHLLSALAKNTQDDSLSPFDDFEMQLDLDSGKAVQAGAEVGEFSDYDFEPLVGGNQEVLLARSPWQRGPAPIGWTGPFIGGIDLLKSEEHRGLVQFLRPGLPPPKEFGGSLALVEFRHTLNEQQEYRWSQARSAALPILAIGLLLGVPGLLLIPIQRIWGSWRRRRSGARVRAETQQRADELRQQWAGPADEFRTESCPYCQAVLVVAGRSHTPQFYCDHCDTLVTRPQTAQQHSPGDEDQYHICPQCRLYGRPQKWVIVRCVFLVVAASWKRSEVRACNVCVREQVVQAWAFNMLTVLFGLLTWPTVVRAYLGGSALSRSYRGLDRANRAALDGKNAEALAGYARIAARLGAAAGVHYNAGVACLRNRDLATAQAHFQRSLADCAGYTPAAAGLMQCHAANA